MKSRVLIRVIGLRDGRRRLLSCIDGLRRTGKVGKWDAVATSYGIILLYYMVIWTDDHFKILILERDHYVFHKKIVFIDDNLRIFSHYK